MIKQDTTKKELEIRLAEIKSRLKHLDKMEYILDAVKSNNKEILRDYLDKGHAGV